MRVTANIAIVKWVVLNHLGVAGDHMRLAYVIIKRTGEKHMVLLYIADPSAPPEKQSALVLDNYVKEVKKGSERMDLIGFYYTDAKGNLVLIADNGSERSVKGVFAERKMKKLDDLKKKIAENRLKYQEINEGRPLLPPSY